MQEVTEELLFCRDCKTDVPLSKFAPSQLKRQRCRDCATRFTTDWVKRNRERVNATARRHLDSSPGARERNRQSAAKWNKANPEKMRAATRNWRVALRDEVLSAYGRECACCSESIERFLTIDHINNDGASHRREIGQGGLSFYTWLKRNNFPEGFQTLCQNCNTGRYQNGGICPHKELCTPINIPQTKYTNCTIQ